MLSHCRMTVQVALTTFFVLVYRVITHPFRTELDRMSSPILLKGRLKLVNAITSSFNSNQFHTWLYKSQVFNEAHNL